MNSEQRRPVVKFQYEKPTAVDLGPTAPVVGASCVIGDFLSIGACDDVGNSAGGACDIGYSA
jgi:hypothetical protein